MGEVRQLIPNERTFVCSECKTRVTQFAPHDLVDVCFTCRFLKLHVPDEKEREELRKKLCTSS